MRREFNQKVRRAVWDRAGQKCEACRATITIGKFHIDHVVADGAGGRPTEDNAMLLCLPCHNEKTRKHDAPLIAKLKRIEARHIGTKAPSRTPLPCGRRSKWKKRMDGTVVPR